MAGSELRQRKGEKDESVASTDQPRPSDTELAKIFQQKMMEAMEEKVRSEAKEDDTEEELQKKVNEGMEKFFEPKKKPLPGLTHETKRAKDALAEDPYNLGLIFDLGEAYIKDEKFTEATNVMIRGWKRVSEFDSPEYRFGFLHQLCQASFEIAKYKQAYAVFLDLEPPEDTDGRLHYWRLACKVNSYCGNLQQALKAFHEMIKNQPFSEAMPLYMDAYASLQKVGAIEAAKSALEQLAETDDDREKLKLCETVSEIKAVLKPEEPIDPKAWKQRDFLLLGLFVVSLALFFLMLYMMEKRSLKTLKLVK